MPRFHSNKRAWSEAGPSDPSAKGEVLTGCAILRAIARSGSAQGPSGKSGVEGTSISSESNIDRLLRARAEIDEQLRKHKSHVTVLFTDVVGSTAYFDRYGDTAGLAMLHRNAELAGRVAAEYRGAVIKTIGDSVMADFPEPALAVRAAVDIQRRLLLLNATLPERERLQLRIGINAGPGLRSEGDVYGDVVNVAARIAKRSGPAQILISRAVRESVALDPDLPCAWLDKVTLAGKTEKEDIFEVVWTDSASYAELRAGMTAALKRGDLVAPGMEVHELARTPPPPHSTPSMPLHDQATMDVVLPSSASATPSMSGGMAARFEILQEIGKGGMGMVYKAKDRETGEVVALKAIRTEIAEDPVAMERFKNEVRLARKITHRNICRTFDFHRTPDGMACISMEFVEGDSLRAILKRFGGLGFRKATEIALEICAGLREAHREGVVHRDLKPENVMLTEEGEAKVMDFGIARSVESGSGVTGTITGTPAYMAPEQAEGKSVDQRTDIYALGLILYEIYTGEQAMRGETPVAVVMKQIQETPPPPSQVLPALPSEIEKAILKCLAKDPAKRFQSVDELELALTRKPEEQPAEATASVQVAPLPVHLALWQRADYYLLGCGLLGVLMFFGLFSRVYPYSAQALRVTEKDAVTKAVAVLQKVQPGVTSTGAKASLRMGSWWDYATRLLTYGLAANRPLSSGAPSLLGWVVRWETGSQVVLDAEGTPGSLGLPRRQPASEASPFSPQSLLPGAVSLVREVFGQDVSKLTPEIGGFKNPTWHYSGGIKWNQPNDTGIVNVIRLDYEREHLRSIFFFKESSDNYLLRLAQERLRGSDLVFVWGLLGAYLIGLLMLVLFFTRNLHRETRPTAALSGLFAALAFGGAIFSIIRFGIVHSGGNREDLPWIGKVVAGVLFFLVAYALLAVTEYYLGSAMPSRVSAWSGLLRNPFGTRSAGLAILRGTMCGATYVGLHATILLLLGVLKVAGPNVGWLHMLDLEWVAGTPTLVLSTSVMTSLLGTPLFLAFPVALAARFSKHKAVFLVVPAILWLVLAGTIPGTWVYPLFPQYLLALLQGLCFGWVFYRYDFLTVVIAFFTIGTAMQTYPGVTLFGQVEPLVTTALLPWFLMLLLGLIIYFFPQWQATRKRVATALE